VQLAEAAAAGLFAIWHCGNHCLLVARPKVRLENGQLHCWDGRPAVEWEGGKGFHYWRGVHVRDAVGENTDALNPRRFLTWRNAEVRRVAIERYGFDRLIRERRARLVSKDRFGKLWHLKSEAEQFAFVEVVDATPTEDGTHKTYYLRVPPKVRSARAAVAWTFGFGRVRDYRPVVET